MKHKIVCLGEALVDVYNNNGVITEQIGGASFNVAASLGKLQNELLFLGAVGNDQQGQAIIQKMNDYNIQTKFLQVNNQPTTKALVTLDKFNDRNFEFIRGADQNYHLNMAELKKESIAAIHFGSATAFLGGSLQDAYNQLTDYAIQEKIYFSFDPNFRDKLWNSESKVAEFIQYCQPLLKNATLIKLSEEELELLSNGQNNEDRLHNLMKINSQALICITQGSKSTLFAWNNEIDEVPVVKSEHVVDTTGAGDSFIAGLINEILDRKINCDSDKDEVYAAIYAANNFAKASVEHVGALTFLNFI
ncbi:carbohydrate kinase family protein [Mesoplasma seiffertii]|uniref:carbohydrate kinase family protein n=1 Tax=Mesoplasma seiffertii TaxID=28224 RepID=UPI0004788313|nr:carbohydrate kinase [Mesoplasma seiffertii]